MIQFNVTKSKGEKTTYTKVDFSSQTVKTALTQLNEVNKVATQSAVIDQERLRKKVQI